MKLDIKQWIRFDLNQENVLIFMDWKGKTDSDFSKLQVYLDEKRLSCAVNRKSGWKVRRKYFDYQGEIDTELTYQVKLPEDWSNGKWLKIAKTKDKKEEVVAKVSVRQLKERRQEIRYKIEHISVQDGRMSVNGWAVGAEPVTIEIYNGTEKCKQESEKRIYRRDIKDIFSELPDTYESGFQIETQILQCDTIRIVFRCQDKTAEYQTTISAVEAQKSDNVIRKICSYYRKNGIKSLLERVGEKAFGQSGKYSYAKWKKKHRVSKKELKAQEHTSFVYEPFFRIVILKSGTSQRLRKSLKKQTYKKWELYSVEDMNQEIRNIPGDFVVFASEDAQLAENALYECVKLLNTEAGRETELIYTDEEETGKPIMKPDFNIDLLRSKNYIKHLLVVKKDVLDKIGNFRSEYDLILQCAEVTEKICHIPQILYYGKETVEPIEEQKMALEEHYKRCGIPAVVEEGLCLGTFHTIYKWEEQPLVSIIIPNKDHIEDLKKCMESIEKKSKYRNFEFIIVENNSVESETFQYYEELKLRENVQVVSYKGGFNFSKINNYGATYARGEYLLLLNNDTEMMNPRCIEEMLGYCQRPEVGVVGARLYYEDDTIQHAGVVIGFGGIAGHAFIGMPRAEAGYMERIMCAQDYSAVTAACMMTKKSVYQAVGGLTEEFEVAFNDIDYCLKVREQGMLIVYNPYVELYHYESKSRGMEDTPEKAERFNSEVERFIERWEQVLEQGDPCYNPNLALNKSDFSLRI